MRRATNAHLCFRSLELKVEKQTNAPSRPRAMICGKYRMTLPQGSQSMKSNSKLELSASAAAASCCMTQELQLRAALRMFMAAHAQAAAQMSDATANAA